MSELFKDKEHLLRVCIICAVGLLGFLLLRMLLVPKTFGVYGHYRAGALTDARSKPLTYAGHEACESCHSDISDLKKSGKHITVNCEACHGPLAKHAADPSSLKPERPNTKILCIKCHETNVAKPKNFPQINLKEHSTGGSCSECHVPHNPSITDTGEPQKEVTGEKN